MKFSAHFTVRTLVEKIYLTSVLFLAICTAYILSAATNYVGTTGTPSGTYFTDIQSAVDASLAGDQVLVSNGVYDTGGKLTPGYSLQNRVVIDKDITVASVNGPAAAIILGKQAAGGGNGADAERCVYMTAGTLEDSEICLNKNTTGSWSRGGGIRMDGNSALVQRPLRQIETTPKHIGEYPVVAS